MNKSSETKKSKENSSRAVNDGNNKNKDSNQKKITSRVIPTIDLIKTCPRSAPNADRIVNLQLNTLKTRKGRATKVSQRIRLVVKK